jgi:hypothetical protein
MSPELYAKGLNVLWGFVAGACVAMLIGFNWGGWNTANTTQKISDDAVLANRVAICVAQFMGAPNHNSKVKEFQGTDNYQRSDLIEKGGWDRMPGEEKAAYGVASGCVTGLEVRLKTGA